VLDAVLFAAATVAAWLLTRWIKSWAPKTRLLDVPNQRSMHTRATPRGGGLAIVLVSLVGLIAALVVEARPDWPVVGGYVAGALLIAGVSFLDDLRRVPAGYRLALHFVAAALMVAGLAPQLTAGREGAIGWLIVGIGILWTVGLTNAYNFMDGIDGLAATQGVVTAAGLAFLAAATNEPYFELFALLVAAGCVGFLIHNWPPARIFMGDIGSAFLGFTFAYLALAVDPVSPRVTFVGALLLWPFIFDALLAVIRRAVRGENIFAAHRSHLYQRLVLAGWHQGSVIALYAVLALVVFAVGIGWQLTKSAAVGYFLVAALFLLCSGLWLFVVRAERVGNKLT
jgi:Fuc2NAc and GlcNAc transferase